MSSLNSLESWINMSRYLRQIGLDFPIFYLWIGVIFFLTLCFFIWWYLPRLCVEIWLAIFHPIVAVLTCWVLLMSQRKVLWKLCMCIKLKILSFQRSDQGESLLMVCELGESRLSFISLCFLNILLQESGLLAAGYDTDQGKGKGCVMQ